MFQLYRKEFSVTLEVITQSHIVRSAETCPPLAHAAQSILSHLLNLRAALCINISSRFGWNARLIKKSLSVLFHKSTSRLNYFPTKNHLILWYISCSANVIMAECVSAIHMSYCSSLDLIKARGLMSLSKQLSSRSVTIYSNKVNSAKGKGTIAPNSLMTKSLTFYN